MNNLKPCPFCGSNELNICEEGRFYTEWLVRCRACEARGPQRDWKALAIDLWNERVVAQKEKKWTYEETQRKVDETYKNMFSFSRYRDFLEQRDLIYSLSGWTEQELKEERIRRM